MVETKLIQSSQFEKYWSHLVDLYIDTFSAEPSFQYLPKSEVEKYFKLFVENGFAVIVEDQNEILVGALFACPLIFDNLFPVSLKSTIVPENTIYIAELMVDKLYRGRGLGTVLLQECLKISENEQFKYAVIRVWKSNKSAVKLYERLGFSIVESIVQQKMKADKTGFRSYEKFYLYKEL